MLRQLATICGRARFLRIAAGAALSVAMSLVALEAQSAPENARFTEGRKHILFIGHCKYDDHDAVSHAAFTMAKLG